MDTYLTRNFLGLTRISRISRRQVATPLLVGFTECIRPDGSCENFFRGSQIRAIAFPLRPANTFRAICVRNKKTLREKKQFKFSLNSVDKMKTTDYTDYSD